MPAVMDDPGGPTLYRVSGQPPFPDPSSPGLPPDIVPRQVTLRDRQTVATIVPFASRHQLPASLLAYLCDQLNREIDGGDTYPMMEAFTVDGFADYWFQTFGAVMLMGNIDSTQDVVDGKDWAKECLGSFFIKPNYPGRSSHICNASFITTDASRNRGVGRLMGEAYIDWAPRLGYTYSVFNLVYETNVASCRIWDALGFKRIGRIKACGNLRSHPDRLIDAIIYGRDLAPGESEELVSEERFDKIRFYLKYGKYPSGADRAEKSRLRSAATHYKLLEGDKLMLKDKEVISDPGRQYEIARNVHAIHHGGINKTTATIADKFHWSRIKETEGRERRHARELSSDALGQQARAGGLMGSLSRPDAASGQAAYANPSDISVLPPARHHSHAHHDHARHAPHQGHHGHHHHNPMLQDQPACHDTYQPIDPQIIDHHGHQHAPSAQDDMPFDQYHPHADFQALLNATEDVGPGQDADADTAAVDRDLEMLIEHEHVDGNEGPMECLDEGRRTEHRDSLYDVGFDGG
ncbi:histone acetyltransferase Spt10 [Metarhizium album ARSEF 1941]|uniref:Histone acetyltransferase Spt10 n=1 Tax=Metarhizium album (strain ARSEF 1941) TaxID=1081103 RepID=A0A0B2X6C5_METAS|nr:histone acetyltransferase Spt10 [Metarhizium album ARSEF 1941]KHO01030.1 histone acetyltransferase Spt10 [Metarhizium album ARSEF 1941]